MMNVQDTDKAWEYFGSTDPYFSVLTLDEYKKENISAENRKKFFESGDAYIALILKFVHDHLDASFKPIDATALDFGCGVGRLVIPLAKSCKSVTGVDISASMLNEAIKNCQEHHLANVNFTKSLNETEGFYDFVHSFIVLQHIPVKRGELILKELIRLLRDNGVGVVHLTYQRKASIGSRLRYFLYTYIPIPFLTGLWNILRKRPFQRPVMQMNEYNLNHIFKILQESDCHHTVVRFTQHGETSGVVLFFQKKYLGFW